VFEALTAGENMSATEIFSIIKDICLAGAAATTAYVAYTGLEKWQKELRGKANFEVARELIKSIYKLRDELSYCRSPFIAALEFPESYRGTRQHTDEENGQAYAHVYTNRWEPVGNAVQNFDTAVLEAEALWGEAIKEKAAILRQCVRSLQVDIESFIDDKYSGGENFKAEREFGKKIRANIWDMKTQENELTNRINAAIEGLEKEITPHFSRS
jgi:hypothetical protein